MRQGAFCRPRFSHALLAPLPELIASIHAPMQCQQLSAVGLQVIQRQ